MKIINRMTAVMGLLALLFVLPTAGADLVRGEDRIDVPAIGDGLCVHNIFQSNMVLQREKPVPVWGWAQAGAEVEVRFAGQTLSAQAGDDRSWRVTLAAMPASSEPRSMLIESGGETVALENIVVGDVWLLGGQSNMEFEIAKVVGGQLEIVSANFENIRLLTVPQQNGPDYKPSFPRMYQWSGWFNRHYRQGYWDVCTPESVRRMSAIGYVFARRIHMASGVPIGVVDASRGGTCIETWLPLDVLKTIDTPEVESKLAEWDAKIAAFDPQKDLEDRINRYNARTERIRQADGDISGRVPPTDTRANPHVNNVNRPGNCYASILHPIAGFAIKGAIWHQGFNNAMQQNGHAMYYQVFPHMIEAWRKAFNDDEMPFGIISLCTAGGPQNLDNYNEMMANEGIYIREVQYKTFRDLREAGDRNVGFASSFDQRRSWYHPQIKIPVGERIAKWALATQYGLSRELKWEPPVCREMKIENGTIVLTLSSSVGAYNDGPILGFAIAGADGKFQPAKAEYLVTGKDSRGRPKTSRNSIVLSSPLVPEPLHYRHAWGRNPLANLKADDIPFATQRSDAWTLADMYRNYVGKKPETPDVLNRGERGQLIKALQAEDMERRLFEARRLLEEHAQKEE